MKAILVFFGVVVLSVFALILLMKKEKINK